MFKSFDPLDESGPLTLAALKDSKVQAADVFTTTPQIITDHLVALADPKYNFAAQNVIPLVYKKAVTTTISSTLNAISAKLTTAGPARHGQGRRPGPRQLRDGGPAGSRRWASQVLTSRAGHSAADSWPAPVPCERGRPGVRLCRWRRSALPCFLARSQETADRVRPAPGPRPARHGP